MYELSPKAVHRFVIAREQNQGYLQWLKLKSGLDTNPRVAGSYLNQKSSPA
jgi:hypothetical protein